PRPSRAPTHATWGDPKCAGRVPLASSACPPATATFVRSATSFSCSRTIFDPASLSERLEALEKDMREPGFWDDQEQAAKVSAEHSRTQRKLDGYRTLESDIDDLEALEEMAAEDESLADELREQYASVA